MLFSSILSALLLVAPPDAPAKAPAVAAAVRIVVDTSDTPDLADWGKRAGETTELWHPKISKLLASDGESPYAEVKIIFKNDRPGIAAAGGSTITISGDWVRKHSDDFGMVVHELTHVIQHYPPTKVGWLVEGIADYVRYFHFEPRKQWPPLNPKASYRDGYGTTARFLAWLEQGTPKIVNRLNAALRQGRYDDGLFQEYAGKPLDELWREFIAAQKAAP
jgi:hypothetical protein